MTTSHSSAFAGAYSDLKFVKSRQVAQVVIEIPIEDANRFLEAFGAPNPAREQWMAIAPLIGRPREREEDVATKEPQARRQWSDMRPSARAALMCKETAFWAFLKVKNEQEATAKLKRHCAIESRRELDADETKLMMFNTIESKFNEWREEKHF